MLELINLIHPVSIKHLFFFLFFIFVKEQVEYFPSVNQFRFHHCLCAAAQEMVNIHYCTHTHTLKFIFTQSHMLRPAAPHKLIKDVREVRGHIVMM